VITTTYKCDRCGATSSVPMAKFTCQLGRRSGGLDKLPNMETGHLCESCEDAWTTRLYRFVLVFLSEEKDGRP
jgi:DNA-directed RNA polymerase subunit RPC12/RpoP